jgi:glutamate racemase
MLGVFDSGVGGLTVLKALRKERPGLPFIYLGDTARTPYGTKSPETVRRYAEEAAAFLIGKGATAIVIACNTASSVAADALRARFPGTPVFEVVAPAVEAALKSSRNRTIGVIGTRATIASGVYERKLKEADPGVRVVSAPAPLLVSLVEEGWADTPEAASVVGKYVAPLREEGIDALILGCTHYPVLKQVIAERAGPDVRLIDSAETAASAFCNILSAEPGTSSYYVTDRTPVFDRLAGEWLGEEAKAQVVELDSASRVWTR